MAASASIRNREDKSALSLCDGSASQENKSFVSKVKPSRNLVKEKKSLKERFVAALPHPFSKGSSVSFDLAPTVIKEKSGDFRFIDKMLAKERSPEEIASAIFHQRGDEPSDDFEIKLATFLIDQDLFPIVVSYYKYAISESVFIERTLARKDCLEILKRCIDQEWSQISVANDFRGNTFASKLCSTFFERELEEQLLSVRKEMCAGMEFWVSTLDQEGREALLKKPSFQGFIKDILNGVYGLKMTDAVADILAHEYQLLTVKFPQDTVEQLIGSRVVLRVVNPYLTDPEYYSNPKQLEIAVEFSRISQKIANRIFYKPQEAGYDLNSLISEYLSVHSNYVQKHLIVANT